MSIWVRYLLVLIRFLLMTENAISGIDTTPNCHWREWVRLLTGKAIENSLAFLAMSQDGAKGRLVLDEKNGRTIVGLPQRREGRKLRDRKGRRGESGRWNEGEFHSESFLERDHCRFPPRARHHLGPPAGWLWDGGERGERSRQPRRARVRRRYRRNLPRSPGRRRCHHAQVPRCESNRHHRRARWEMHAAARSGTKLVCKTRVSKTVWYSKPAWALWHKF